jgi:hypothetical protein
MKHFKVTFIKVSALQSVSKSVILIEQDYFTDKETIEIKTPLGYAVLSITEYLEPVTQLIDNEKKILKN